MANSAPNMKMEDDPTSPDEHRWLGYDGLQPGGRFVSVCSCGWRSATLSTAGLAASAWDTHKIETAGGRRD